MATVTTDVPINSQGVCPDPSAIQSQVHTLDLIVYQLVPASPSDDISDWQFVSYCVLKQGGGLVELTLGLGGTPYLTALVLARLKLGTTEVNLKIKNAASGAEVVIDPMIIHI